MANNNIAKRLVFPQENINFATHLLNIAILIMQKKYDPKQIQPGWKYCFNAHCPKREHCLRFQSALEIPDDNECGGAVYPTALKDGKCRFYRKDEKVRLATGFVVEGNQHATNMFVEMRHQITNYLGGNGTYYLYRNGKKWLTPRQQDDIRSIFRNAGYSEEVIFGKEEETYDFT